MKEQRSPPALLVDGPLRAEYGIRVFTIQEAENFTLCRTKYLDRPHLRRGALKPPEDTGDLVVVECLL